MTPAMRAPVTDAERLIEDAQRWSHAAPRWPAAVVVPPAEGLAEFEAIAVEMFGSEWRGCSK